MDPQQFKTIILPYHADMYRLAFSILRDADDAADVVQDTFLKLWEHRSELLSVKNHRAYCLSAVKNQACSELRKSRPESPLDSAPVSDMTDPYYDTADAIERTDSIAMISRIIDDMPERQRTVFTLSTFASCSNEEISRLTGLSNVNVRAILSRTRRQIKNIFSNLTV